MNRFRALAAGALLSAALVVSGPAQAMEIRQFDKMADDDQAEYVADLIQGSEDLLNNAGQHNQADKLRHLFVDIASGDHISLGMAELHVNLAGVRAAEVSRQARDTKLRHLDVEDAFKATAEDHGISLPAGVLSVNSKFRPKLPPK